MTIIAQIIDNNCTALVCQKEAFFLQSLSASSVVTLTQTENFKASGHAAKCQPDAEQLLHDQHTTETLAAKILAQ